MARIKVSESIRYSIKLESGKTQDYQTLKEAKAGKYLNGHENAAREGESK